MLLLRCKQEAQTQTHMPNFPLKVRRTFGTSLSLSVAPHASQDKAGRLNFPHFAIQAAPGENAENVDEADCLCFHTNISEAQSWRKRNMTHQRSHERAPASAHASAHASVHESAHKSWLSPCYSPIQRLPLECSRECSRGCPRKCTRSGLVVCHLVCFHLLCSLPRTVGV